MESVTASQNIQWVIYDLSDINVICVEGVVSGKSISKRFILADSLPLGILAERENLIARKKAILAQKRRIPGVEELSRLEDIKTIFQKHLVDYQDHLVVALGTKGARVCSTW